MSLRKQFYEEARDLKITAEAEGWIIPHLKKLNEPGSSLDYYLSWLVEIERELEEARTQLAEFEKVFEAPRDTLIHYTFEVANIGNKETLINEHGFRKKDFKDSPLNGITYTIKEIPSGSGINVIPYEGILRIPKDVPLGLIVDMISEDIAERRFGHSIYDYDLVTALRLEENEEPDEEYVEIGKMLVKKFPKYNYTFSEDLNAYNKNEGLCSFDFMRYIAAYDEVGGLSFRKKFGIRGMTKEFVERVILKNVLVNGRELSSGITIQEFVDHFAKKYGIPVYAFDATNVCFIKYIPEKRARPAAIFVVSDNHIWPITDEKHKKSLKEKASNHIQISEFIAKKKNPFLEKDNSGDIVPEVIVDPKYEDLSTFDYPVIVVYKDCNLNKLYKRIVKEENRICGCGKKAFPKMKANSILEFDYNENVKIKAINEYDISVKIQRALGYEDVEPKGLIEIAFEILRDYKTANHLVDFSSYNNSTKTILETPLLAKNWLLKSCESYGIDIRGAYVRTFKDFREPYCAFTESDQIEPTDKLIYCKKLQDYKAGFYYVETEDIELFNKSGWYPMGLVKDAIEFGVPHKIKAVILSQNSINADFYDQFINYIYEKLPYELAKKILVVFTGLLARKSSSRREAILTTSLNEASRYYFKNKESTFVSDWLQEENPEEKLYSVKWTDKVYFEENTMPIYNQMMANYYRNLYRLIRELKAQGKEIIGIKTDCVVCKADKVIVEPIKQVSTVSIYKVLEKKYELSLSQQRAVKNYLKYSTNIDLLSEIIENGDFCDCPDIDVYSECLQKWIKEPECKNRDEHYFAHELINEWANHYKSEKNVEAEKAKSENVKKVGEEYRKSLQAKANLDLPFCTCEEQNNCKDRENHLYKFEIPLKRNIVKQIFPKWPELEIVNPEWNKEVLTEAPDQELVNRLYRELLGGKGYFVNGAGGTGKTHIVAKGIIDKCDKEGISYMTMALSNKAARLLNGQTIHRFLGINDDHQISKKLERIVEKAKILIFDEVSMLNDTIYSCLRQIKKLENPPGMLFVGDFRQLQPILRHVDIPCLHPNNVPKYKNSLIFKYLCDSNMVKLTKCLRADTETFDKCMKIYKGHFVQLKRGNKKRALAFTNQKRVEVNEELNKKYAPKGSLYVKRPNKTIELGRKTKRVVHMESGIYFHEGLPVIAFGTLWEDGEIIFANSEFYEVVEATIDQVKLQGPDGGDKKITITMEVFMKYFGLGYCMTVHKAQGQTFDFEYTIYEWEKFDKHMKYTAVSRATNINNVYLAARVVNNMNNVCLSDPQSN